MPPGSASPALTHPPPFGGRPRWPRPGSGRWQRNWTSLRVAALLRDRRRFLACEVVRFDGQPRAWEVRGLGTVVLRSGTSDIDILEEICVRRIYDPPDEARQTLRREPVRLVADLGANIGLFALQALDAYPDARVVSYEPDPWNLEVLNACRALTPGRSRWEVRPVAAAAAPGAKRFLALGGALSRQARAGETGSIAVAAEDAIPLVCRADIVKIDIEGGEWELLADPRLRRGRARVVVVEFHAEGCPGLEPAGEARASLERAGYDVQVMPGADTLCGQLWAWRP